MKTKTSISAGKKQQRGYMLTELLLTVAIIAVVLSGIAGVIATQSATQISQREGGIIQMAINDLRLIFRRQPSFIGFNMATSTQVELWPTNRVTAPGVVSSAWGSNINFVVDGALDPSNQTMRADIDDVPQEGCSDFASYAFSASRIAIDGQVVLNTTGFGPQLNPIDIVAVAAQCDSAPSDVSIWFTKDYF